MSLAASVLLAIGLYASTYGIDSFEARAHIRLIGAAVTIGVVLKAAIIGFSLYWIFNDPIFLVFGIAMAQIDPLAVSALDKGHMSAKATTILRAWSSFDDPVTTLLTVCVMTGTTRIHETDVALDIALVLVAIAGLLFRPIAQHTMKRIATGTFFAAILVLGIELVNDVDIMRGIALGVVTYIAQIVVSLPLTHRLERDDRIQLALAQQNGITAIILALLLETRYDGVTATVGPAIIVVYVMHLGTNHLYQRRFRGNVQSSSDNVESCNSL